ncbi:reverse transcriptase domain-containing protein [Rhodoferax mekongensis]|uniref:Reverse transcriptase domain-containing protein n=1 Tax=Rhodoferax mekongensis TaxID=3068341 RepID=A0ABZ0AWN3_9BURK|nr:reverse transcriptase domain-containing protein [Rhodoferax sp. TBRC 17307]WNO04057.1 reverse transcriptase domain-containing protein [Rhodoferax sp. TBRC 17307]
MKITERLETLRKLNRNPAWVNDDLFRLVSSPQLAVLAYERLKSIAGNMTKGADGSTLDETSLESLKALCSAIRDERYSPVAVKRKFIPKANGKLRPLGIPSPRDKIVQEMVRLILECIYDAELPVFDDASHGFRANRGCHSALHEYSKWNSLKWVIEGDIVGFFDNIDHHILISILRKKIKDERFIRLIWKFLRTPILHDDGKLENPTKGTPQGGVISPYLANIYLHEFDIWVRSLQTLLNKGDSRRGPNPAWRKLTRRRLYILKKNGGVETQETKQLRNEADMLPSVNPMDPGFCRVYYVRYADDWLIGISGDKSLALDLKSKAETFLRDTLKLTLSEEKTLITHATTEVAKFLGFRLSVSDGNRAGTRRMAIHNGFRVSLRRTVSSKIRIIAPVVELLDRLKLGGFCRTRGDNPFFPCSKKNFVALEDHDIVMRFNSVWRGIYNYYAVSNNASDLNRVKYVLQYSCLMTLAHKHRMRLPKVVAKYGVYASVRYRSSKDEEREVSFWRPSGNWQLPLLGSDPPDPEDILASQNRRLTRTSLTRNCVVCNTSGVQMHHIRHLRKGNKTITQGFNRIMSAINRKQVPLCRPCHGRVHRGEYDGLSLKDLAYIPT